MSDKLPLPTLEYEITLSTSSIHINMNVGDALRRYRRSLELGDESLAVAWVLHDVLRDLDRSVRKQSAI